MEVLILSNAKYDADIVVRYDPKTPHLLPFSMSFSKDRSLSILRDEDLITRAHLYIRPLCNTTIIATSYSFDLLVDGTVERVRILLHASLAAASNLARTLTLTVCLQQGHQRSMAQPSTPIIPLLMPRARALSYHLLAYGLDARPSAYLCCQRAWTEYACAYMLAICALRLILWSTRLLHGLQASSRKSE
jgi:hypothetical protein